MVLHINPSTVRTLIPARLDRNSRALDALLRLNEAQGIRVIGYISPIRQDLPNPYDAREYAAWKAATQALFVQRHAQLINLESLVPAAEWGQYDLTGAIDFVHFRNRGHQLVADALRPYVANTLRSEN
jgi:lysophospholipase L1-like esterase